MPREVYSYYSCILLCLILGLCEFLVFPLYMPREVYSYYSCILLCLILVLCMFLVFPLYMPREVFLEFECLCTLVTLEGSNIRVYSGVGQEVITTLEQLHTETALMGSAVWGCLGSGTSHGGRLDATPRYCPQCLVKWTL
jgi:hypothetical protein